MPTLAIAHQLLAVEISEPESATLLAIATHPGRMIGGTTTHTAVARRCRQLARKRLARYVNSAQGGWPAGMWAAYPTCNGFNAMWRHAGDTHIDRCGSPWNSGGTCSGCRTRRRLDLPAYEQYLAALSIPDRQAELRTSALWCIEHGYIRRIDVTTQKTCPFKGSSVHDGGLDRIGHIHLAV